ncbi:hypothetical protein TPHA_0J01620 [Tetrapisispora phaffii CBS 4417]|uniref:2-dehydropantoate 2-reductase n=1 Tax=Tetrapisispora phaffii (strain ATCC 24235 / CBS 4417 / NBRC 1672 / NRRL Y-8282 / UCD 70-5) TaxID=1071381 RepID=G8BYP1_TETPH|nr:hypothetical protein TPHA_0J01620 [Tetrapisispora phaffii CBS 4417]CCE64983.1 hypothetical protein TPHA_0J01620 [Tetrapisispora phaffii CBS 4417]
MSEENKPNVIVIGAGGVGVVTAYSLSFNGGSKVSMVIRSDYRHVIKNGYTINSCDYGKIEGWKPDFIYSSTAEAAKESSVFFDYVVVTTKNIPDGPKNSTVSEIIRPLVEANDKMNSDKKTSVILVQNGIDLEKELIEKFDASRLNLISGIQFIGSTKIGKGVIDQIGKDRLFVGSFDPSASDSKQAAQKYIELYSNKDYNIVEYEPRSRYARWKKLLYNAAINTTTALVGLDVPRALQFSINGQTSTEKMIFEPAMREIIAIAATEGIVIEEEFIDFFLNISKNILFKPSMCVDAEKGQLMELEVILGNPIRIANKNNVSTPTLSMLYGLLTLVQSKLKEQKGLLKFDEKTLSLKESS